MLCCIMLCGTDCASQINFIYLFLIGPAIRGFKVRCVQAICQKNRIFKFIFQIFSQLVSCVARLEIYVRLKSNIN